MKVVIMPIARAQIARIDVWWRANRIYAPSLFSDELQGAILRFTVEPRSGTLMQVNPESRRLLLRRTRYHVHADIYEDRVEIILVRGAMRRPLHPR